MHPPHIVATAQRAWLVVSPAVIAGTIMNMVNRSLTGTQSKERLVSKHKLNHKRRKKMRRKIKRQDIGWEQVLTELTISEIQTDRHLSKKGGK